MHGEHEGECDGQAVGDHGVQSVDSLQAGSHEDHDQGEERRQVPVVVVDGRDEIDAVGEKEAEERKHRPPAGDLSRCEQPDRQQVGHHDRDDDQDQAGQRRRGRAPDLVERFEVVQQQCHVAADLPAEPLKPRQRRAAGK